MKYFLDTEFIEGPQKKWFGYTKPTIDLISIGIVAEDNREYYAISKDFNLKEAWNRFQYTIDYQGGGAKEYWIRENVLKPIFHELMNCEHREMFGNDIDQLEWDVIDTSVEGMSYKYFKKLLKRYGKTNTEIAEEVKEFCLIDKKDAARHCFECGKTVREQRNGCHSITCYKQGLNYIDKPEFYGYYCDYDWVVFCWLFGLMIDLPKGFPMYCRDLKQMLDEKQDKFNLDRDGILSGRKQHDHTCGYLKGFHDYPKQKDEHNALADAKWNFELYKFLEKL